MNLVSAQRDAVQADVARISSDQREQRQLLGQLYVTEQSLDDDRSARTEAVAYLAQIQAAGRAQRAGVGGRREHDQRPDRAAAEGGGGGARGRRRQRALHLAGHRPDQSGIRVHAVPVRAVRPGMPAEALPQRPRHRRRVWQPHRRGGRGDRLHRTVRALRLRQLHHHRQRQRLADPVRPPRAFRDPQRPDGREGTADRLRGDDAATRPAATCTSG